jgi:broad specificity phosphatase PhoE
MGATRVYFVRHGERADNSSSIYASPDIPLSENGRRQAALLGARFSAATIEVMYSSPYLRTRDTTEIINIIIKTKIRYNSLIEELGKEEDVLATFRRAREFIQILESSPEKCILVSSHAGIIKMIVFAMVFEELQLADAFREFNNSFHMDYTGVTYCKYSEKYGWHIVTWNDLGHLSPPV